MRIFKSLKCNFRHLKKVIFRDLTKDIGASKNDRKSKKKIGENKIW